LGGKVQERHQRDAGFLFLREEGNSLGAHTASGPKKGGEKKKRRENKDRSHPSPHRILNSGKQRWGHGAVLERGRRKKLCREGAVLRNCNSLRPENGTWGGSRKAWKAKKVETGLKRGERIHHKGYGSPNKELSEIAWKESGGGEWEGLGKKCRPVYVHGRILPHDSPSNHGITWPKKKRDCRM